MARKPEYHNWRNEYGARKYAYAHGYYGGDGGWIYCEKSKEEVKHTREGVTNYKTSRFHGRPICQGWRNFYRLYRREIHAWIDHLQESGIDFFEKQDEVVTLVQQVFDLCGDDTGMTLPPVSMAESVKDLLDIERKAKKLLNDCQHPSC